MKKFILQKPVEPRHRIERLGDTVRIVLPSKKNILWTIWNGLFLIVWAAMLAVFVFFFGMMILVSGYGTFSSQVDANNIFLLLLVFMILMFLYLLALGLPGMYSFMRHISGKEIFDISSDTIRITQQIFDWQRPREYSSNLVKDLRLSTRRLHIFPPIASIKIQLGQNGRITFDYGEKAVRFGLDIDEAEAKQIIAVIVQQLEEPKII